MKTIWKYQLESPVQILEMPDGAEVLTAQYQNGALCLWAIVDSVKDLKPRSFEVIGTGHEIGYFKRKYISTVQKDGFVWHIFEVEKPV